MNRRTHGWWHASRVLITTLAALAAIPAAAQDVCGSLQNSYGPMDYRSAPQNVRDLVESHHFTKKVELLQGGQETYIGGDIDYTLRAFPNHPRALLAMMNLSFREKRDPPPNSRYSVTCWFERAERFQPDDPMVKVLYGSFLVRLGKKDEAAKKLDTAAASHDLGPNEAYNLGLAYSDLGRYDDALKFAHMAYEMGFPLPGLRDRLVKAGKWKDLPPLEKADASAPAADAKP
ncbi:hypothetical protein ACDA63_08750 [Uliginosibacterium sp. sgz301328]|uniref:hypothetical protein n=1 Tax=Uliginosibacterium sp. sgz301328 TaxID=3243764 RepID=UPI00359CF004